MSCNDSEDFDLACFCIDFDLSEVSGEGVISIVGRAAPAFSVEDRFAAEFSEEFFKRD